MLERRELHARDLLDEGELEVLLQPLSGLEEASEGEVGPHEAVDVPQLCCRARLHALDLVRPQVEGVRLVLVARAHLLQGCVDGGDEDAAHRGSLTSVAVRHSDDDSCLAVVVGDDVESLDTLPLRRGELELPRTHALEVSSRCKDSSLE